MSSFCPSSLSREISDGGRGWSCAATRVKSTVGSMATECRLRRHFRDGRSCMVRIGIVALALAVGASAAAAPLKKVGKGEGEVSIVAWPGYIERGETDKAYDWVTAFEKETGCKVSVKN